MKIFYGWVIVAAGIVMTCVGIGSMLSLGVFLQPMSEAMGLIHRAGGLAILAHPGSLGTRERVAALAAAGLDGLEILHPSHSWEDSQRLDALATEFDLVRSGGSDWHGAPDGARALGMMRVPSQWLSDQRKRVATRGSRRVA